MFALRDGGMIASDHATVTSMSDDPTNADLLAAMQGRWRQQKDLIGGVEQRLGAKIGKVEERLDAKIGKVEERLDAKLQATEKRLGDRLAQEIKDRPVVVHVDMSRVTELERRVEDLAERLAALESRSAS